MKKVNLSVYKFTPNEKQKILLVLIYIANHLPVQTLRFFENVITKSNLTYKIIPPLERNGLIERKLLGYSKYGQREVMLKGKALYDTFVLTRLGTSYVLGTLGVSDEVETLHNFYLKNNVQTDLNMEERFKRSVLTDVMFRKDAFINCILSCDFITSKTREILDKELKNIENKIGDKYFFRGIECKRTNFDFNVLGTSEEQVLESAGNNIAGSKFFGVYLTTQDGLYKNIYPVYNGNYYNVSVTHNTEAQLKNKLWSETRGNVDNCIYVFQDTNKIKSLLQRNTDPKWQTNPSLYSCELYENIYLFKYDKVFLTQIDIFELDKITNNRRSYWKEYFQHTRMFNNEFNKTSFRTAVIEAPMFDAKLGTQNYYIGYEQELNSLQLIIDYMIDHQDEELVIVCLEEQNEFYSDLLQEELDNKIIFYNTCKIPFKEGVVY